MSMTKPYRYWNTTYYKSQWNGKKELYKVKILYPPIAISRRHSQFVLTQHDFKIRNTHQEEKRKKNTLHFRHPKKIKAQVKAFD